MGLLLQMVDVVDRCHWRWLLTDEASGQPQADQEVGPPPETPEGQASTVLTAIAPEPVHWLGCAVVAMRYLVTDDFAIGLADELYERNRPGHTRITGRGRKVLGKYADRVGMKVLFPFEEYREFRFRKRKRAKPTGDPVDLSAWMFLHWRRYRLVAEAHTALADELVERLRNAPPEFLEQRSVVCSG